MALGASRSPVFRLVLGQGLVLATLGLTVGLITAVGVARFLETVPFGVEPVDLSVYLGVALLLGRGDAGGGIRSRAPSVRP